MLERIKEIVAESLGTEAGTLTESTSFKEDLEGIQTIGDVEAYIQNREK